MDTPVLDFVRRYAEGDTVRLHMPGHKGRVRLGPEPLDITEIGGADSLYEAEGILLQSERNAGRLFGAHTFYSTEGSSHAIRAMLYLVMRAAGKDNCRILAARNVHKSFLTAVALLDLTVAWLNGESDSYLSCRIEPRALEEAILSVRPSALYLTSPDYLGNLQDIAALAAVCHRHGVLLLVDNAHGAYLHFLESRCHPLDLGADLVCDSAHKTLPALTGAAYLHVSQAAPGGLAEEAKEALALFGSTSPSYLTLASLDGLNPYLESEFPIRLAALSHCAAAARVALCAAGYRMVGDELLKWSILPKSYGYTGTALAELLRAEGIEAEFADPDCLVLMLSPENGEAALARAKETLLSLPRRTPISKLPPPPCRAPQKMRVREAVLAPHETVATTSAVGRVMASLSFSCPPAVPILVCGECITEAAVRALTYYGIDRVKVVK